jgi:uncharacterized membrane-anchored protein
MRKVPEIIIYFWIIKLLTTAMGEATSDFLVFRYNPYLAVIIAAVIFTIALLIQLSVTQYNAWIYWFTVTMVAVFGTMAADGVHKQLNVPYLASTIFFAIVLSVVFTLWYKSEKTLSIHSINTRRRELFYWASILSTFALGTAAGDLAAHTFGLGYLVAGLFFTFLFFIPAVAYFLTANHQVLWFWIAYVLTRPLGASFADWLRKPSSLSGLGYGDGHVAVILTILIFILVSYMAISHKDISPNTRRNN